MSTRYQKTYVRKLRRMKKQADKWNAARPNDDLRICKPMIPAMGGRPAVWMYEQLIDWDGATERVRGLFIESVARSLKELGVEEDATT